MAKSEAEICNLALLRAGQTNTIASLGDASPEAKACAIAYPAARDELLTAKRWPFATRSVVLALLSGVTRPGWTYAYAVPKDMLAPQYLFSGARPGAPVSAYLSATDVRFGPFAASQLPAINGAAPEVSYEIQANDAGSGQVLVTDQEDAQLVYTVALATVTSFPTAFVKALSWRLAAELALSLAKKPALAEAFDRKAEFELAKAYAELRNQQQGDPQPDSSFIAVRG